MKRSISTLSCLFFSLTMLCCQTDMASQLVAFNYTNIRLEDALQDVSERYVVRFAYSRNYIPVDHKISVNVRQVPFSEGLDSLLAEVPVGFQFIGNQIVLKEDRSKKLIKRNRPLSFLRRRKKAEPKSTPRPLEERLEIEGDNSYLEWQKSTHKEETITDADPGSSESAYEELKEIEYGLEQESIAAVQKRKTSWRVNRRPSKKEIQQQPVAWSILPFIGAHMDRSDEFTNAWSFNVIWGYNGGVNGLEFGLLGNSIERNMRGVQFAGIGSTVGENVTGAQAGGIFNYVRRTTVGLQAAGVVNSTNRLKGLQGAGITNIVYEYAKGAQVAGIGNVVLGVSDAAQFGGVFNATTGRASFQAAGMLNYAPKVSIGQISGFTNVADQVNGAQIAGIINVADKVNGAQVAGVINVAEKVNGTQIGLINFCDSISGMPIGLLNFVRYGYNRFELAGSEALYLNAALKLGGHKFYNILHTGFRYDENGLNAQAGRSESMTWALGYGLGTVIPWGRNWQFNIEAVSMHVNESERWTNKLNLLNQLRLTADVDWNGTSFFFGPTLNIMASRLYDADTQTYGSAIAPYTFYDKTRTGTDPTNTKMWVGFHAGFRW